MPVTVGGTSITFNDSTVQSTAATITSTDFGGVGSYAILMMAANTNLGIGATIAGSSLRYNPSYSTSGTNFALFTNNPLVGGAYISGENGYYVQNGLRVANSSGYNGGGTALSGTWRKVSPGSTYIVQAGQYGSTWHWADSLYVRIS
jgi:hypothetical protein